MKFDDASPRLQMKDQKPPSDINKQYMTIGQRQSPLKRQAYKWPRSQHIPHRHS